MGALRFAGCARLKRGVPAVVAGLVSAVALAVAGPVQASAASRTQAAAARATALDGTWGTAEQVPGIAALNHGNASLSSVSCPSPGDCGAGGGYTPGSNPSHQQAFVVGETGGAWGTAEEVPGTAALNKDKYARLTSVSCPSAGNCSADGFYADGSGHQQVFVVSETGGTWGTAEEVPGTAALNKGGYAELTSISCVAVGYCTAGGSYTESSDHQQAFVVSEKGGTWGTAKVVPGIAALATDKYAELSSVSCSAAGNCGAGGWYLDGSGHVQVFVVSEAGGTWGTAEEVPGTAAVNKAGLAQLPSVSCSSAGYCSAGGWYHTHHEDGFTQPFVVSEKGGTWGTAEEVPGIAALNSGLQYAELTSVSCRAAGNCSAGGYYTDSSNDQQAFVVGEAGGTWGTAKEVPGTAGLNLGGSAGVAQVSCASAGYCSAGGYYTDKSGQQAFVVGETGGTWGTAKEVPGTAGLNLGGSAGVAQVSCASAGHCSAAGYYTDSSGHQQAFVVNET